MEESENVKIIAEKFSKEKMDEVMLESIKSTIIDSFKEENPEEAMNKIDSMLSDLKTEECKAMMATYLLSKLSFGVQINLLKNHEVLIKAGMGSLLCSDPFSKALLAASFLLKK